VKIKEYTDPFPYVIIEDLYNKEELKLIWEELDFLCYSHKLLPPNQTGSARLHKLVEAKKNAGVFLEQIYYNPDTSNIMRVSQKIFEYITGDYKKINSWFCQNSNTEGLSTLVSYYENGDYYYPHQDSNLITILNWFFKEPKKFSGGNLYFPDFSIDVKLRNNTTIIFPGMIRHAVEDIRMDEKHHNKKLGRFCISQFLSQK